MARKRNVALEAEMSDNPEEFDADTVEAAPHPPPAQSAVPDPITPEPPQIPVPPDAMAAFAQMLAQAI